VLGVKIAVTTALVGLILRHVSLAAIVEGVRAADPEMLAAAVAIGILFTLLKSYKWCYLVCRSGGRCTFATALRSYLIGMGAGLVTPGRVGEVSRAYYLPDGERLRGAGLVGVDKLLDLGAVFSLACVGGFIVIGGAVGIGCAAVTAVLLGFLYRPQMPLRFVERLLAGRWGESRIIPVLDAFRALGRIELNVSLAMTYAAYAIVLIEFYLLVLAFEPVSFGPVLLVFPVVMLMNVLPITIAGLGVREGTSALLLSQFGVSQEAAVGAAFLIFSFNTLLPGLAGALLLLRRRAT
jgi:uncharacterized protein (TIRG00374 family)